MFLCERIFSRWNGWCVRLFVHRSRPTTQQEKRVKLSEDEKFLQRLIRLRVGWSRFVGGRRCVARLRQGETVSVTTTKKLDEDSLRSNRRVTTRPPHNPLKRSFERRRAAATTSFTFEKFDEFFQIVDLCSHLSDEIFF